MTGTVIPFPGTTVPAITIIDNEHIDVEEARVRKIRELEEQIGRLECQLLDLIHLYRQRKHRRSFSHLVASIAKTATKIEELRALTE